MMAQPARILYLEDNLSDVELVRARFAAEGIACEIVGVQTSTDSPQSLAQKVREVLSSP